MEHHSFTTCFVTVEMSLEISLKISSAVKKVLGNNRKKIRALIGLKSRLSLSNRPQVSMVYLVNKPLQAAGMSADNVRG